MNKRITCFLIAIVMLLGLLPIGYVPAYAEQTTPTVSEETLPAIGEETVPSTSEATVPSATEETVPPTTEETVPETTEATVPETTEETVPEATEETVPETTEETVPETTEETVPETTEETVPETTEETVPETTEETVPEVTEPAKMTTSDECIKLLKQEEGFSKKPYWDYSQYTVGYGTCCPSDMVEYYTQHGITEAEAETLLRNHLARVESRIHSKIIDQYGITLTQNQFDALVLFSYNCGTAWAYDSEGTLHKAVVSGATGNDLIRAFALWCSAGGQIRTFLLRRRLSESNLYLNNIYNRTPPENYCYVLYDANGGTVSPRSQGYDANLTAAPYPVATLAGYTFQGWFTAKTGGEKVTVLDASTKSVTVYAQWKDAAGNPPPETGATAQNPVTVTVTASDVNLRQGPGTNYTRVGVASKGQQFVITETATGSGYTWGKFDGGWIALVYTDYDTVISQKPEETPEESKPTDPTEPPVTEPPVTEPPVTEPPVTEPPVTEPPVTEPPVTEPPVTEPPVTEPPVTEPEKEKVTGTINVQDWLRVRSGPGTSYSVVDYLEPKQKVEILEQTTTGSMKWGKISNGWISMDYVILDKTTSSDNTGSTESKPTVTTWTGTVNVQDWLRVRTGPGTSYAVSDFLGPKEKVTITERKTVGNMEWGKIATGWICMDYVVLDKTSGTTTQPVTKTITADCLNIRQGAGLSYRIVGYLYYGAKVQVLEIKTLSDGSQWGRISDGWISMVYAK